MLRQLSVMFSVLGLCLVLGPASGSLLTEGARADTDADLSSIVLEAWRDLYARPSGQQAGQPKGRVSVSDPSVVAAFGARLFNDTRMSGDGQRSCASCHDLKKGFADNRKTSASPNGRAGKRNTPTLWNIGWAAALHWDGSITGLEEQAAHPIRSATELGSSVDDVLLKLNADPALISEFRIAFPDAAQLTAPHVFTALAVYQRSLISPITRFDRWVGGILDALSNQERNGFRLFVGKGGCARCHNSWRFTDDKLHDIGLPKSEQRTAFKTPTLRELRTTAPYMHDGSIPTLDAAVRHYAKNVVERSSLSPNLAVGLSLDDDEITQLVAFLKTLSRPQ